MLIENSIIAEELIFYDYTEDDEEVTIPEHINFQIQTLIFDVNLKKISNFDLNII